MTWLEVYNACCARMQNGTWKPHEPFDLKGEATLRGQKPEETDEHRQIVRDDRP